MTTEQRPRRVMAGPQRLAGNVAIVACGFVVMIAALPTWTLPGARESYLADRVAWWSPELLAQGNPFPLAAFVSAVLAFVVVTVSRLRQRPTFWPIWLLLVAIGFTVVGVLVGGAWFLTVNVVGVLFTALGMAFLMVNRTRPKP